MRLIIVSATMNINTNPIAPRINDNNAYVLDRLASDHIV